jgi:hypothetical protein
MTTITDVRQSFRCLVGTAQRAKISQADNWVLEEGCASAGRAFRLYLVTPPSGALHETCLGSYLGSTRREAELTLDAYSRALGARGGGW